MKWLAHILLVVLPVLFGLAGHGHVAPRSLAVSPSPALNSFQPAEQKCCQGEGDAENVAQRQDTLVPNSITVQAIPKKFILQTEAKATRYAKRITDRTEKALRKLARWEGKIKALLEKANPETAQRLFGNPQLTFAWLLEQCQRGQQIANDYGKQYDEYRDRLGNTMDYLSAQNTMAKKAGKQLKQLDSLVDNAETVQKFIRERKRQLIEQSIGYIGKSKYFQKISRENYYYVETLRNYKTIFQDEKKTEELAVKLLHKIPGFTDFLQRNSAVAVLFGFGQPIGGGNAAPNLVGLQTRASVTALIQNQIAAGGPGAQQAIAQNIQQAQTQFSRLKDKVAQGGDSDGELPNFKPNNTKTKTFLQRIEYTANVGFGKINPLASGINTNNTADIALGIGYKLNDKSTVGIGASYKLGMGSLQRVRFSGQGLGLRSFIDWKLKKQFYISGGYEMNYLPAMEGLRIPTPFGSNAANVWQRSGLIGISKKMRLRTKWFKTSSVQLLYDMLHGQQRPVGQPWIFRMGYSFK